MDKLVEKTPDILERTDTPLKLLALVAILIVFAALMMFAKADSGDRFRAFRMLFFGAVLLFAALLPSVLPRSLSSPAESAASSPLPTPQRQPDATKIPEDSHKEPAPPPPEHKTVNLTGTWREPGGNMVTITQTGSQVTMRMPYLEAMGINPAFTTLSGTVSASPDPNYSACLNAGNGTMSAQLYVANDGNRLEGKVNSGFSSLPSVLTRN